MCLIVQIFFSLNKNLYVNLWDKKQIDDVKMKFGLMVQHYYHVQTNYHSSDLFKFWMVSVCFYVIDSRIQDKSNYNAVFDKKCHRMLTAAFASFQSK